MAALDTGLRRYDKVACWCGTICLILSTRSAAFVAVVDWFALPAMRWSSSTTWIAAVVGPWLSGWSGS